MRIYLAAPLNLAELCRKLSKELSNKIEIMSTWHDSEEIGLPINNVTQRRLADRSIAEIQNCDGMLCFGLEDLSGNRIAKVGAMLSLNCPVILAGDYHSQYDRHSLVTKVPFFDAIKAVNEMVMKWESSQDDLTVDKKLEKWADKDENKPKYEDYDANH